MENTVESYQQTYTYDLGNNLTRLSHQTNSSIWQQTISIHPNNNQGTETNPSATNFDTNGNLLTLNNIGTLDWHYNNTLSKLTKNDKSTTEYYVYNHQGNRVRTVLESSQKIQSQRDYLPSLDISIVEQNQTSNTLHIGTHILSETNKSTTQTRYQLKSHLQSSTLELNDKAQVISFEHFYPYGGTTLIAGKDQTQVAQKRYRYTGKETDDSSGLSYYGARYLATWMARWISPDSVGNIDGLNLYVYVSNNPLKYNDPTGHMIELATIPWDGFVSAANKYMEKNKLNIWVGELHDRVEGKNLMLALDWSITHKRDIIFEETSCNTPPVLWWHKKTFSALYKRYLASGLNPKQAMELTKSRAAINYLISYRDSGGIGEENWADVMRDKEILTTKGLLIKGADILVGAGHVLSHGLIDEAKQFLHNENAYPAYLSLAPDSSIALVPLEALNIILTSMDALNRDSLKEKEFALWVLDADGSSKNAFLVLGKEHVMKNAFGPIVTELPQNLFHLAEPDDTAQAFKLPGPPKRKSCCTIL